MNSRDIALEHVLYVNREMGMESVEILTSVGVEMDRPVGMVTVVDILEIIHREMVFQR